MLKDTADIGKVSMTIDRHFSPRVETFLNRISADYLEDLAAMFEDGKITENGFTPAQEEKILEAAKVARKAKPISEEAFLQELKEIADAD